LPELPEVEVVVRQLRARLRGARLGPVQVDHPDVFLPAPGLGPADTGGRRVEAVERRAKLILVRLSGDLTLTVHLRMTGRLGVESALASREPHTHVRVPLPHGRELRYVDSRRFGRVQLLDAAALAADPFLARLGPEPLGLVPAALDRGLATRTGPLKGALLDQSLVAGLGNIYADEILHRAGLHPRLVACRVKPGELRRLVTEMDAVLRDAIRHGGSTIADYRSLGQAPGRFQDRHAVFGRGGQPCRRCGETIVKIRVAGRGTHLCPGCQPHRRRKRTRRRVRGEAR